MRRVQRLLLILAGCFCAGLAMAAPVAGAQDGLTTRELLHFLHINCFAKVLVIKRFCIPYMVRCFLYFLFSSFFL